MLEYGGAYFWDGDMCGFSLDFWSFEEDDKSRSGDGCGSGGDG